MTGVPEQRESTAGRPTASGSTASGWSEASLAQVLLVRACEESDPDAEFATRRERSHAGRDAQRALAGAEGAAPALEPFVRVRAERLAERLEARHPALASARAVAHARLPSVVVCAVALCIGLGVDALGGRRVNLLAPPLLGLIAWNALAYLALAATPWARGRRLPDRLARAAARIAALRGVRGVAPGGAAWVGASLRRFAELWVARAGDLLAARARIALHAGALALALGVVLGMYVRGLAFEYRAGWG
ncbi:MAG: hypothetical protein QNK03_02165, partial [Myxococcota bacterium]|nr:hypothetical protein [Myxococcota bacterium]